MKERTFFSGAIEDIRILVVIPGKASDKSYPFARRQVSSLSRIYGIKVKVFYLETRKSPLKLAKLALKFRNLERKFKPHAVHCHYGSVTSLFTVLIAKAPVIITYHGSDLNCTPWVGYCRDVFGRVCSQWAALGATHIICVSQKLKDLLYWRKNITSIIPMGVDTEEFYPQDKDICRKILNWKESEKVVLFNANKALIKRLDIALDTIAFVKIKNKDVRLEILKGDVEPEKLPVYINASDCVLLCSDNEGSPTIIKEAMACNVPVVSIDIGDVKVNIKGTSPGGIYFKNKESLAHGILEVINQNISSNGRNILIERDLISEKLDQKVIVTYLEVLNIKVPKELLFHKSHRQTINMQSTA